MRSLDVTSQVAASPSGWNSSVPASIVAAVGAVRAGERDRGLAGHAGRADEHDPPGLPLMRVVEHHASLERVRDVRVERSDPELLAPERVEHVVVARRVAGRDVGAVRLGQAPTERGRDRHDGRRTSDPSHPPRIGALGRGVAPFLLQGGHHAVVQIVRGRAVVRRVREPRDALRERRHVGPASGTSAQVAADLEILGALERPEQMLGQQLAHFVTRHAAPPPSPPAGAGAPCGSWSSPSRSGYLPSRQLPRWSCRRSTPVRGPLAARPRAVP